MGTRIGVRWLSTLFVAAAAVITAASCGGAGNSTPGQPDASDGTDDSGSSVFVTSDAGTKSCVPKTCTELGYTCGMNGDGCGATLDCGGCPAGQFCGGGGYSLCGGSTGTLPDGGDGGQTTACTQETCQS